MNKKSFKKRTNIFLVILAVVLLNGLALKADATPNEESSVVAKGAVTNAQREWNTLTEKTEKVTNDSFFDDYAFLKIRYKFVPHKNQ